MLFFALTPTDGVGMPPLRQVRRGSNPTGLAEASILKEVCWKEVCWATHAREVRLHRLHGKKGANRARPLLLCGLLLAIHSNPGCFPAGWPSLAAQVPGALQREPVSLPPGPPRAWIEAAAANQDHLLTGDEAAPVRYRVRKVDARGDMTREEIESREGSVARLIQRNGGPLTTAEDSAERERLHDILASPSAFLERRQRSRAARGYARELIDAMPQAMLWSYAPGQPQPGGERGVQVVVDFAPDPHYKPPTVVTEALRGVAGRIWIDARSQCVTRIEGRVLHPVDFGWGGILARVSEGGTIVFEQTAVGEHRWLSSRLSEHVVIREVLIHTVKENVEMTAWDAHLLPGPVSYQEAIQTLLAMPVPTR